jgi:hypothetical protein
MAKAIPLFFEIDFPGNGGFIRYPADALRARFILWVHVVV